MISVGKDRLSLRLVLVVALGEARGRAARLDSDISRAVMCGRAMGPGYGSNKGASVVAVYRDNARAR